MSGEKEWFETWFDSPYYHILYKKRNFEVAKAFISNLIDYLNPSNNSKMLDLACGAGRHSIYLNSFGYDVVGLDLSPNSIAKAKEFEKNNLHFDVHDMRDVYRPEGFDYIFNMFTSFGYFQSSDDNMKMLQSVNQSLKKGGVFVLDFFNVESIIPRIKEREEKEVNGITFHISKKYQDETIHKKIKFSDKGKDYAFEENVQAFTLQDLKSMVEKANLKIKATFGDYELGAFNKETSDRLILIIEKA